MMSDGGPRASWRKEARAKEAISLAELNQIMKETMKEVDVASGAYTHEDPMFVYKFYKPFFTSVSKRTQRLNPTSLKLCAKDLFQLGDHTADLLGKSLSNTFSFALKTCKKAVTGEKLPEELRGLMHFLKSEEAPDRGGTAIKAERPATLKTESASSVKLETGTQAPVAQRGIKRSLSSPTQLFKLYSGGASPPRHKKEEWKDRLHACMYVWFWRLLQ